MLAVSSFNGRLMAFSSTFLTTSPSRSRFTRSVGVVPFTARSALIRRTE
jgi:hypothetical protein